MSWVTSSPTRPFRASASAGLLSSTLWATLAARASNCSPRATKSVSHSRADMATVLPSALTAAITRPSLVARPDFLAALAIPFWRSQSTAFSRSPSTSTRAFLQSIMPAPVFSRSSFTIAAEIAIVFSCVSGLGRSKIPKKSRSAQGGGTALKPRRHLLKHGGAGALPLRFLRRPPRGIPVRARTSAGPMSGATALPEVRRPYQNYSAAASVSAAFCMASSALASTAAPSFIWASPSWQASEKAVTNSLMARMASSLPGMM